MFLEIFDELSCQKKRTLKLRALALINQSSKEYTVQDAYNRLKEQRISGRHFLIFSPNRTLAGRNKPVVSNLKAENHVLGVLKPFQAFCSMTDFV